MYIFKIIPIVKGLSENYFTYFYNEKILLGALVEIKIRNRKILGIVISNEELKDKKLDIKSSKFIIKKIEKVLIDNFLSEEIFKSISESATLLGVKESEILENYLPEFLFENIDILNKKDNKKDGKKYIEEIYLKNFEERNKKYFEKIKENQKKKKSAIIFFPTINDLEVTKKYIENLFDSQNILSFYSGQTKKILNENLKKIIERKFFLILSTPSIFPILLKDKINLETIILEKENSFNYFTHTKKKQIDAREIIKKLANDLNINLILGGNILSLETFKKVIKSERDEKTSELKRKFEENTFPDFHAAGYEEKNISSKFLYSKYQNNFEIISLAKYKLEKEAIENHTKKIKEKNDKNIEKYSPVYFSNELIEKLEKIKSNKEKAFLYAKRKGLYTETICADCNTIFKCEKCDKPYILFKKESLNNYNTNNAERVYMCNGCKEKIELKKSINLTCKNCASWRMNTLGVGVGGIEENLKEIGFKTFLIDSNNIKTKKDINGILKSWQKEKDASILIGTDLALNFLNKDFECNLGAVISLDSLFSIPEINIDEKIFNICLEMKERINTKKKMKEKIIIQTRLPDQNVWDYIKKENILEFLEEEIKTRKLLSLPPFSNILKWQINKKDIRMKIEIEKILKKIFKEESLPFEVLAKNRENINYKIDKKTGNHIANMIIKKEFWQKEKDGKIIPSSFAKKVTTLLSDFKLEINPPNIY